MKFGIAVNYGFEELHPVLVPEGRKATDHLMEETSETPPVNVKAMPNFLYDLWS